MRYDRSALVHRGKSIVAEFQPPMIDVEVDIRLLETTGQPGVQYIDRDPLRLF
jgi:hypothetical protein